MFALRAARHRTDRDVATQVRVAIARAGGGGVRGTQTMRWFRLSSLTEVPAAKLEVTALATPPPVQIPLAHVPDPEAAREGGEAVADGRGYRAHSGLVASRWFDAVGAGGNEGQRKAQGSGTQERVDLRAAITSKQGAGQEAPVSDDILEHRLPS